MLEVVEEHVDREGVASGQGLELPILQCGVFGLAHVEVGGNAQASQHGQVRLVVEGSPASEDTYLMACGLHGGEEDGKEAGKGDENTLYIDSTSCSRGCCCWDGDIHTGTV